MTDQWRGHPWGYTDDHRPVGNGEAICAGCDERCSQQVGCMCCNELAYEWLLEEARWWAGQCRDELATVLTDALRRSYDRAVPWDGPANYPYPWETLS